ncbi:MAG TPA: tetratricopeptide repeat protein [Alphaproteobacteria bacterium]|nr:tetratricopeptide repeat protein [Alphaproteobacteria bacterium]
MKPIAGLFLGIMILLAPLLLWAAFPAAPLDSAIVAVAQGRYSEALEQLATIPMPTLTPQERHRARYLFAHAAQRLKRYPEALQAFGEIVDHSVELGDYALWNIARIYQDINAEPLYVEALKTLLKRFPQSRLAPQAHLALSRQLVGVTGELAEGERVLADYLAQHAGHASMPEAYLLLGQAYTGLGQTDKALQAYRTLFIRFPTSPEAELAVPRIEALAQPAQGVLGWLTPQEQLDRADQLAAAGECDRATLEVRQMSAEVLSMDLAARRARRLGFCAFRLGRYREAITTLEGFQQVFSAEEHTPEALYILALSYQREGRPGEAERILRQLAERRPQTPWNAKALVTLGLSLEARQGLDRAVGVYREIVTRFPEADRADELAWRIGWFHYGQRQFNAAARDFEAAAESFPRSMFASNALYWQAKALERSGRGAPALALYERVARDFPYTYYGIRAQEVVHAKSSHNAAWVSALAAARSLPFVGETVSRHEFEPTLPSQALFHRVRVDALVRLRFLDDAREEVAQLAKHLGDGLAEQMLLARLYLKVDMALHAIRTLNATLSNMTPEDRRSLAADFWSLLFPQLYWDEVREAARFTSLDPLLLLGVIRQESGFNHRAVSRSDARGLMQLLPSTGREVFQRLGMGVFRHEVLFDPRLNVRLGSHYLGRLAETHGGNLVLALAAYNAGPGRVKRWLQEINTDDWDEFIERLPFEETRGYVKTVLRNYGVYQRLYGLTTDGQAAR